MRLRTKFALLAGVGVAYAPTAEANWPLCNPPDQDPQLICQWQVESQMSQWEYYCWGNGNPAMCPAVSINCHFDGNGCYADVETQFYGCYEMPPSQYCMS